MSHVGAIAKADFIFRRPLPLPYIKEGTWEVRPHISHMCVCNFLLRNFSCFVFIVYLTVSGEEFSAGKTARGATNCALLYAILVLALPSQQFAFPPTLYTLGGRCFQSTL